MLLVSKGWWLLTTFVLTLMAQIVERNMGGPHNLMGRACAKIQYHFLGWSQKISHLWRGIFFNTLTLLISQDLCGGTALRKRMRKSCPDNDDDGDDDGDDLYIIGAVCLSRKMITLPNWLKSSDGYGFSWFQVGFSWFFLVLNGFSWF